MSRSTPAAGPSHVLRDPAKGAPLLPVEDVGSSVGWIRQCLRTVPRLVFAPARSFVAVAEPVDHGRVLRFLATLVLPVWGILVGVLATRVALEVLSSAPRPIPSRAIHALVDPAAAQAASTWLLLMVPVALPCLYLITGLVAHIGIALTGGATRSIGSSMRAVGYALGPAMLAIGLLDFPLYLGFVGSPTYLTVLVGVGLGLWWMAGSALARTHRIWRVRGLLVAILPATLFVAIVVAHAVLVVPNLPFLDPPPSPYYIP